MKIIIFGNRQAASLARFYLEHDAHDSVAAFTVDGKYCDGTLFEELPLIPFEEINNYYPPQDYMMFCPLVENKAREIKLNEAKKKGYKIYSYVHSTCIASSFASGENNFILEGNIIQAYVKMGNNIMMWTCNHIGHHSEIESHVFMASHVVVSGNCKVGKYSWFGVNCTIRNHINIAEGTFVCMGASVKNNTAIGEKCR